MTVFRGTAADLDDLMTQIGSFLTGISGTDWVLDQGTAVVPGEFAISRSGATLYVQFRWNTTTPTHMSVHQSLAYDGSGTGPGNHTGDSGNGYAAGSRDGSIANTLLDDERHVSDIGDGPFGDFFVYTGADDERCYVVVEVSAGVFRHFGCGVLSKAGSWTGGEFAYGNKIDNNFTRSSAYNFRDYGLIDGASSQNPSNDTWLNQATIRAQGLTGQHVDSRWIVPTVESDGGTPGTDTGGNARERAQGGFRGGPVANHFGNFLSDPTDGAIHTIPVGVWHCRPNTAVPPDEVSYLGRMPGVRALNIRNFTAKEQIRIGGIPWRVFPFSKRSITAEDHASYYSGIAYRED